MVWIGVRWLILEFGGRLCCCNNKPCDTFWEIGSSIAKHIGKLMKIKTHWHKVSILHRCPFCKALLQRTIYGFKGDKQRHIKLKFCGAVYSTEDYLEYVQTMSLVLLHKSSTLLTQNQHSGCSLDQPIFNLFPKDTFYILWYLFWSLKRLLQQNLSVLTTCTNH